MISFNGPHTCGDCWGFMASYSSKFLGQIAFNLFLLVILLVLLVLIVINLISSIGHLGENLFLLIVICIGLFIGIGFLVRIIRAEQGKNKTPR